MNLLARMETDEIQEYLMHELNTPLTVIKGYVEMLQDKNNGTPEITKYLDAIWKNAERIEKAPLSVVEKIKRDKNSLIASD